MVHPSLSSAAAGIVEKQRQEDVESDVSTEVGDSDHEHDTGDRIFKSTICSDSLTGSFSPEETLLIFDWDDTIFPTTWIEQEGLLADTPTPEQAAQLQHLADRVDSTLKAAKHKGKVVIITNAAQGWVELSCSLFMPSLLQHLQDIDVISARSSFERNAQHAEWKCMAFEAQVRSFYGASVRQRRNIVSLGDALYEHRALAAVTQCVPNCYAKSLKFMEKPQVEHLADEHDMIAACLTDVIDTDCNLDLEISSEN